MVGDLVRSKDKQETIRVKEILNFEVDGIVHQGINGSWACFECLGWYECDDIEPIPLTDEILENNGFDIDYHHAMFYFNKDTLDEVRVHVDYAEDYDIDSPDYRMSGCCRNVHELQHALRFCGLEELADNFKIK